MVELTPDQIEILGRPNFACSGIAKALIAAGLYATGPKKAEFEQAVCIHWMQSLNEKFGDGWREEGDKILSECHKKIEAENA